MNTVLSLAPRFQRAGGRDARVTTALAITAFAVSTGLTLSVVGGLLGFAARADLPLAPGEQDVRSLYETLAWVAVILLVVPLVTLGGAAARLGVARRDARLATLRLLGATPREVVGLTVAETAWQGLVGAVLGILLYVVLLPLCALLPFQGTTFSVAELWVGWQGLAIALVAVPLLAALSGAFSLRRVAVSPLGVARRETPKKMTWLRVVVAAVGIGTFMLVSAVAGALGAAAVAALLGAMAVGFATLNAVGPWVLGLVGKVQLRRATTPARLLAARRLLDDPKAAWRVVGGLGLAGFVAGALAVLPSMTAIDTSQDPQGAILMDDLVTGAMVTLVVAFLLAAVSAGIAQAASVLDRRREIALQNLAGTPVELHDSVRRRTVLVPLLFVAVGSAVTALVMFFPLLGLAAVSSPQGPLMLVAFLAGGCALVFAATETSRPLLRSVLADTVVRAD
ncbi:FtsX-like permease family protein [Cellulomonas humilata]|uniref:MFS family permease n=1 Tax=Cellulomonas humilata TaxID=144055 RepID=A0ABU0EK15_9CELL|nr:FtsX-like permease family protein [Cellulomonas humilata]MDQ0375635.1 MFS family permease [Cellulomonas humilata]